MDSLLHPEEPETDPSINRASVVPLFHPGWDVSILVLSRAMAFVSPVSDLRDIGRPVSPEGSLVAIVAFGPRGILEELLGNAAGAHSS